MEVGRVIVEDDRIAVPERSRFAIKDADGFDEGDVTGYSFGRRCTGADKPHSFGSAGGREDIVGFDFGAIVKLHGDGLSILMTDAADTGAEP